MRSLRIVYSAINSEALSSRSGGIDGRPSALYIWSKIGDSPLSATSAKDLIRRSGCSLEIRSSKFTTINIVRCRRSSPRIRRLLLLHYIHHLPPTKGKYVSLVFQHPASQYGSYSSVVSAFTNGCGRVNPRRRSEYHCLHRSLIR